MSPPVTVVCTRDFFSVSCPLRTCLRVTVALPKVTPPSDTFGSAIERAWLSWKAKYFYQTLINRVNTFISSNELLFLSTTLKAKISFQLLYPLVATVTVSPYCKARLRFYACANMESRAKATSAVTLNTTFSECLASQLRQIMVSTYK